MRLLYSFFLLGLVVSTAQAGGSPLLNRAAEKWMGEGNRWAFTVLVQEVSNGVTGEVRVEHYDPSKPAADRWELMTVDGKAPTAERRAAWQRVKARKLWKTPKSLAEYIDLDNATATGGTAGTVSYLVPMRSSHSVLFPVDQVVLTITVNKATLAIEEVKAGLNEPYHVALGLARIIEVNFDVKMNPSPAPGAVVGPATSQPAGVAHVVLSRLTKRIEYTWSDFHRVTPATEASAE